MSILRNFLICTSIVLLGHSASAMDTIFVAKGCKLDTFKAGNFYPLEISGMSPKYVNDSFGMEYVNINIKCANVSNLAIYLYDPLGNYYLLTYYDGTSGKNFDSTFLTDTASQNIHFAKAPYKGTYISQSFLRQINNGQGINGTWYLGIWDYNTARKDYVVNWSLRFGTKPITHVKLDSTKLPILVVNTQGVTIPWDDARSGTCLMYAIDNGTGAYNHLKDSSLYPGHGTIELHGNYSRYFPKVSFNIRTADKNYNDSNRVLFGMPKEREWSLIANYPDRSLMRNALAQHIFAGMGNYSPRVKHVELIINNVYMGVYSLIEKIKIDKNRVNIAKMDDNDTLGDSLTGGYMIKQDWKGSYGWYSRYSMPSYPNSWYPYFRYFQPSVPATQQANYIKSYFDSFENAINGNTDSSKITGGLGNWRNFASEKSLTDFFFTEEITKNLDGFRASYYMYKDRNSRDRHIHLGPVWDFDWSMATSGWQQEFNTWEYNNGWGSGFWWYKLLGTSGYGKGDGKWKDFAKCRWTVYRRNHLSFTQLDNWIDSNAVYLSDAQKRNFREWPEFGNVTGVLAVGQPVLAKNYKGEVDALKSWMHKRLGWLDKNIPGTCREDIDAPVVKLKWKDTVYLEVHTAYIDSGITFTDNFGDSNVTVLKGTNLDTAVLGTYVYNYFLSDSAGNRSTVKRTIIVIDTLAPTITFLNGDSLTIEVLEEYKDTDVVVKDNYDLHPKTVVSGNFNFVGNVPDTLGDYYRIYTSTDSVGNTDSAIKYFHVVDSKAPRIKNNASDSIFVEVYHSFSDSGISIADNYDKIPTMIYRGPFVNHKPDSIGIFTIWYVGSDLSGNMDSINRTLVVFDTISPVLNLNGSDSVFIAQDSIYIDAGYTLTDNYDKFPLADTSGTYINSDSPGVYSVIYNATDNSGNKSIEINRVIVVSKNSGIFSFKEGLRELIISPNPSGAKFSISIKTSSAGRYIINIYNTLGAKLDGYNYEFRDSWNGVIDLSGLPAGVYNLSVSSDHSHYYSRILLVK